MKKANTQALRIPFYTYTKAAIFKELPGRAGKELYLPSETGAAGALRVHEVINPGTNPPPWDPLQCAQEQREFHNRYFIDFQKTYYWYPF